MTAKPEGTAANFACRLADDGGEAVVLSTCNRTEVYLAHREPKAAAARAHAGLARVGHFRRRELAAALSAVYDDAAALQLFRVAAGLDSLIPGSARCARPPIRFALAVKTRNGHQCPFLKGRCAHPLGMESYEAN